MTIPLESEMRPVFSFQQILGCEPRSSNSSIFIGRRQGFRTRLEVQGTYHAKHIVRIAFIVAKHTVENLLTMVSQTQEAHGAENRRPGS